MDYSEFPKVLKAREAGVDDVVVRDADEQAAVLAAGKHRAPAPWKSPTAPSDDPVAPAPIEYPKALYRGEDQTPRIVTDADTEAAAVADGYLAREAPAGDVSPASTPAIGKGRGSRRSKAE